MGERPWAVEELCSDDAIDRCQANHVGRSSIVRKQSSAPDCGFECQRVGGIGRDLAAPHGRYHAVLMDTSNSGMGAERYERRGRDRRERWHDSVERKEPHLQDTAGIDCRGAHEAIALVGRQHVSWSDGGRAPAHHFKQQGREVSAAQCVAEESEQVAITAVLAHDAPHCGVQSLIVHAVHQARLRSADAMNGSSSGASHDDVAEAERAGHRLRLSRVLRGPRCATAVRLGAFTPGRGR